MRHLNCNIGAKFCNAEQIKCNIGGKMLEKEKITQPVSDLNTQCRRWFITINNPFGTDVPEVDINNTDLPIKEDYYNLSYINDGNLDYFDFKYVEICHTDMSNFTEEKFIVKRPFFKNIECVKSYFENLEHFKYYMFQVEKGIDEETEHIQGTIFFNVGKRFQTFKSYLPTAHIEKVKGTNTQVRYYCSKSDTRIDGPFEFGQFAEERERTDVRDFVSLVQAGASKSELSRLYPHLYVRERNKIDSITADTYEEYGYRLRDIDVTYIYGDSGVGKTTYVRRKIGLKDTFFVHSYDNAMFTNYKYQDNIVLDEFAGQMKLQTLNQLLDTKPFEMRGLGCLKYATFHHIYIISNYKPTELYRQIQEDNPKIFQSFNRRLHNILFMDDKGNVRIERETIWEDCDNDIDKEQGLCKQILKTMQYDKYGNAYTIFDRHADSAEQLMIPVDEDDPVNSLF